jgi:hypothetical protein
MHAEGPSPHSVHLLSARTLGLLSCTSLAHDACTEQRRNSNGDLLVPCSLRNVEVILLTHVNNFSHATSKSKPWSYEILRNAAPSVTLVHSSAYK